MRGIGNHTHQCSEYAIVTLFIPGIIGGRPAIASISHQLHIVDGLQAKVLVGIDILGPEQAIVDIGRERLTLPLCKDLQAELSVTPKQARTTGKVVLASKKVTVPANSIMPVPVRLKKATQLPPNQDFVFQPAARGLNLGLQGGPRAHIVDTNFSFIEV